MLLIGHRGAPTVAPQNSAASLDAALAQGADGVEFDVRQTADGHLVVVHDALPLATLRLADVRARTPWVLTLDELIARYSGRCLLNAELKDPLCAERAACVLADGIPHDQLIISSFWDPALAAARRVRPGVRRGVLAGGDWGDSVRRGDDRPAQRLRNARSDLLIVEHSYLPHVAPSELPDEVWTWPLHGELFGTAMRVPSGEQIAAARAGGLGGVIADVLTC